MHSASMLLPGEAVGVGFRRVFHRFLREKRKEVEMDRQIPCCFCCKLTSKKYHTAPVSSRFEETLIWTTNGRGYTKLPLNGRRICMWSGT